MTDIPSPDASTADYQPARALWARYQPERAPLRFQASSASEAREWQAEARRGLGDLLGFLPDAEPGSPTWLPDAPFDAQTIEQVDKGDYLREKLVLRTSAYTRMPVYLLRPKGQPGPLPVVLALHGHGYGVKDIVGLSEAGEERDAPEGYQKNFGVALCRRGFLVAAPEISSFGERQSDFSYLDRALGQEPPPSTCHHTAALAAHLGGSAAGLRVRDGIRLVDYLETRPEADTTRLGAMGISGGGMHAFFSACMDPRIRAAVVSGYFCSWRQSILAMHHCVCNFVPGLHQLGEIYDAVGLIAPRPLLVEAGTLDPIFPLAGVEEAVARALEVYRVFGAGHLLETDYFAGDHQIHGARAYDFLWEKLAG